MMTTKTYTLRDLVKEGRSEYGVATEMGYLIATLIDGEIVSLSLHTDKETSIFTKQEQNND